MNDTTLNRIVAILPNWLGDAVMCTPALRAIAQRHPQARLTVLGRSAACAILEGLPYIHGKIVIPAKPSLADCWHIRRIFRMQRPDAVIIFPHSFRAALLGIATGAKRRCGQDRNGRGFLLTDRIDPIRENGRIRPIYMVDEYLALTYPLGCTDDHKGPGLAIDKPLHESIRTQLTPGQPWIGLAPGGAFGPSKRWPIERFAQTADAIAEKTNVRFVVLTGPGEESLRDTLIKSARTPITVCDGGQPTLETLKATIAALDLLICNDSGPRHVAVALHTPTVCIMGPTSPAYTNSPYEHGQVIRIEVDCGPCQKPICETDHRCMLGIHPAQVAETVLELLASRR